MQPVSAMELTAGAGVKALVYGPAGAGKTTLCATMPKPIIISAESGLLSLRKVIQSTGVDLPVLQVSNMQELHEAFLYVSGPDGAQFESVCLDSISEIAEVCLTGEKGMTKDGRAAYGQMNEKMVKIIRLFRDLQGKHVLFTAKQETTKDALTGAVSYAPSMPGTTLTKELPYFFDEVFQSFVGQDGEGKSYRALLTELTAQATAKDRSGMLDAVEFPDMNAVIAKIIS